MCPGIGTSLSQLRRPLRSARGVRTASRMNAGRNELGGRAQRTCLACALVLVAAPACGGGSSEAEGPPPVPADTLQTGTGGAESSEGTEELGELAPVTTPAADETPVEPTNAAQTTEPQRIEVPPAAAGAEAEDVPLEEGAFAFGGFRIVGVPRRTVAKRLSTAPNIWEIKSRDGKRVALIQQVPWSRIEGQALPATGAGSERNGRTMRLDDWGGRGATIIAERFTTTMFEYRIERLSTRSDWIVSGWQDETETNP